MGDKTQLAVASMAAKTGSPVSVFLGGALALALLTLIGVLAGNVVARTVPMSWVSRGAAVVFVLIGALMLAGAI